MDEEVKELEKSYALSIQFAFYARVNGKHPNCKQPSNIAKRRKTSK